MGRAPTLRTETARIRPEMVYAWRGPSLLITDNRGECGDDETLRRAITSAKPVDFCARCGSRSTASGPGCARSAAVHRRNRLRLRPSRDAPLRWRRQRPGRRRDRPRSARHPVSGADLLVSSSRGSRRARDLSARRRTARVRRWPASRPGCSGPTSRTFRRRTPASASRRGRRERTPRKGGSAFATSIPICARNPHPAVRRAVRGNRRESVGGAG